MSFTLEILANTPVPSIIFKELFFRLYKKIRSNDLNKTQPSDSIISQICSSSNICILFFSTSDVYSKKPYLFFFQKPKSLKKPVKTLSSMHLTDLIMVSLGVGYSCQLAPLYSNKPLLFAT